MQAIFDEQFQNAALPQGWYTDTFFPKYSEGRWDCRGWDGVVIPLPHDSWNTLRVEVELTDIGANANAFVGADSRNALSVSFSDDVTARHYAAEGGLVIGQSAAHISKSESATLVYEWTPETMRVEVNGIEVLCAPNLRKSARAGSFHTGFRDCIVTRVAAFGEVSPQVPIALRALGKDYPLEVTVDFNDDLMACAWTHQTFENLFKELKSWGTRTVSWIDIGRAEDGFFDFAPYGTGPHGLETFRNVGDIFSAAVAHAHRENIELIGILKPFDMAIQGFCTPPNAEATMRDARIHRIGGGTAWTTHMAENNQHLLMARRPSNFGNAKNEIWTRLDLVKEDDGESAISPDDITLLVSDDNDNFREYSGPISRTETIEEYAIYRSTPSGPRPTNQTRRARVLRFENLEIKEAFLAIQVRGSARSFANRLLDLVHVFGKNGEETHLTYGLSPRRSSHVEIFEASPGSANTRSVSLQGGFEYNCYPGAPSGMMTAGGEPMNSFLALDRGATSYIALAKGKDKSPLAVMSPSFPETRALWMTWAEAMLDSGADGIDLRPGHHHADFAWSEYGFEEPVREEMLKRTGVDIWETDDFDYNQWRKIRGEGWTQFIREASALTRARGKKFIAHIDGHFDNPPNLGGAMNIVTDWRCWIEEGLLDGISGKALWPSSSFAREVLALAHAKNIPVSYVPYCNNFFEDRTTTNHLGGSPKGCEIPVERFLNWGRENGYDSFGFYECASALRATQDGAVNFRSNAEPLREVMRRHFHSTD